jgi:hypothetical protein
MSDSSTKTAVITAVLTGVFTVVAGIATYWFTTKEPALSYSVTGGPTLAGALGTKRIFVVEVRNSGKKEIAQTLVQLAIKAGELSEVAAEATPGVKLTEEKTSHQIDIRADLLNPGDTVKVSLLTSMPSVDAEPKVTVRAPGVQGVADGGRRYGVLSLGKWEGLSVLLIPAVAAVLSSLILPLLPRTELGRKLGLKAPGGPSMDQSEIAAYVCGACGLIEEASELRFGGSEVSYRGVADYLRHRALARASEERRPFEIALRALLLNEEIAERSISTIRWALGAIAPAKISDAEFEELRKSAVVESQNPELWRERVDLYVNEHVKAG